MINHYCLLGFVSWIDSLGVGDLAKDTCVPYIRTRPKIKSDQFVRVTVNTRAPRSRAQLLSDLNPSQCVCSPEKATSQAKSIVRHGSSIVSNCVQSFIRRSSARLYRKRHRNATSGARSRQTSGNVWAGMDCTILSPDPWRFLHTLQYVLATETRLLTIDGVMWMRLAFSKTITKQNSSQIAQTVKFRGLAQCKVFNS